MKIKIKRSDEGIGLPLPKYHSIDAAGFDLHSAEDTVIKPGEWKLVSTGISIEIPKGHYGMVVPRSGLAAKHGISIVNSPGTVDADYRGIVYVNLMNNSKADFLIKRGDRIAQMIIKEYNQAELIEVDILSDTKRGEGGFGSTGK